MELEKENQEAETTDKDVEEKIVTVVFLDSETGDESFRVDFSESKYKKIVDSAEAAKMTLEEFFAAALRALVETFPEEPVDKKDEI